MQITFTKTASLDVQGSPSFLEGRNHPHILMAARPRTGERNEGLTLDASRNSQYRWKMMRSRSNPRKRLESRIGLGVGICASLFCGALLFQACASPDLEDSAQNQESADPSDEQGSESEAGSPEQESSPGSKDPSPKTPEPSPEDPTPGDEDPGEESDLPDSSQKFDLGTMPEAEKPDENGLRPCEIDFLFVVDNSGSMATKQENLSNSVPKFIESMMNSTELEKDYHIGVVTTDENKGNAPQCAFSGGLILQTKQFSTTNQCGPYKSGKSYMTDKDDLNKTFKCAAKPGISGNVREKAMDALRDAIDPKNGAKGKCNEGFLREEAILVAVIITDEDDVERFDGSKGTPEQWHQQLLAAKGGDEKKLVVISIVVPPKPNACKPGDAFARETENLISFTKKFGKRGFVADVCEMNYDPIFKKALGIIDYACGELHPPPG